MRFVGIDPSSKTGLVTLDQYGATEMADEIVLKSGLNSSSKEIQEYGRKIAGFVNKDDLVCIEGFSFGSKGSGVSLQYGIGYAIRFALIDGGIKFFVPTPSQVKKFATGKGNTSKENMILPLERVWGFEHESNNVRDAFVLAQIARAIRMGSASTAYQREVVATILSSKNCA